MTESEFWLHFVAALRKGTSLLEELTRIPMTDVKMEPEDWTTMYDVADVAKRFKVDERAICRWIRKKKLRAKKIGREYVITLAMIKDMLNYDRERLDKVPWIVLQEPTPGPVISLSKIEPAKFAVLMCEAQELRKLYV